MSYKETLYFIATCLTISLEEINKQSIEKQLQSDTIDWDAVVKVSTAHYVFPALYCNLNRAGFLQYLPQELVSYMEHIANLNRERNQQIITQAKDLNTLLLVNNITPIFLKGTGNLLADLYEDIAERMVGDIDFICSKEVYTKAIKVLINNGYFHVDELDLTVPDFRHYRRLKIEKNIAAVEIHQELLLKKYANEFNYSFIEKDNQVINGFKVLSYANKLNLSIIANQINDSGYYYKTIALRNAYDVFLLSKKTNAKAAVNTLDKLNHPINCFLATCYEVFNKVDSLEYHKTAKIASYLSVFNSQFSNSKKTKRHQKIIKSYLFIKSRITVLCRFILHKEYRVGVFKIIADKKGHKKN